MSRREYLRRDSNELDEKMAMDEYEFSMRNRYDDQGMRRDPNYTIVHWAVQYADARSAQLIIEKYPQFVTVADAAGFAPLNYVSKCRVNIDDYDSMNGINATKAIISALKLAGADFNANPLPLYSALAANFVTNPEIVRHLLQLGADINLPGPGGQKPIHFLLNYGQDIEQVLPILVELGADINEVVNTLQGLCSPIDIVLKKNIFSHRPYRRTILTLLQQCGASLPTSADVIRLLAEYPAPAAVTFAAPTFNPPSLAARIAAIIENSAGILRAIKAKFGLAPDASENEVENAISQIEDYIKEQDANDICKKYTCPVHLGLMLDPVIDGNGITSDRSSAELWRERNTNTSVSHRGPMTDTRLLPNILVRDFIIGFIETKVVAIQELAAKKAEEAATENAAKIERNRL